MGPKQIGEQIAQEQGWSYAVLYDVVCGYIENQGDDVAFEDYVRDIARIENQQRAEQGS